MKPYVIFVLWVVAGWYLGSWAEALAGVLAVVGLLGGIAVGAMLALEARRQLAASAARAPQAQTSLSMEASATLDRAA